MTHWNKYNVNGYLVLLELQLSKKVGVDKIRAIGLCMSSLVKLWGKNWLTEWGTEKHNLRVVGCMTHKSVVMLIECCVEKWRIWKHAIFQTNHLKFSILKYFHENSFSKNILLIVSQVLMFSIKTHLSSFYYLSIVPIFKKHFYQSIHLTNWIFKKKFNSKNNVCQISYFSTHSEIPLLSKWSFAS